ncbi:GH25 family lysozyme [Enterococcus gilvus]|uniref:GH25 family lysozyme n=2 Tax=Enterococcus gilvus TaxID=160453 RepID=UPI0028D6218C|nr:GH25 family lysozyme [Enterococcus gilvus]
MKKYLYFFLASSTLLGLVVDVSYASTTVENSNQSTSSSSKELINSSMRMTTSSLDKSSDANKTDMTTIDSANSSKKSSDTSTTSFSEDSNSTSNEKKEIPSLPGTITNEFGTFVMPSNRSDIDKTNEKQDQLLQSIPADGTNLPSKSFVDVSSNNGQLSVANFQKMKSFGVRGVIVKLTEGTTYTNPYASSQIANARSAGLKVSAYHFARYLNTNSAIAEANYFVQTAKNLGLGTDTVMVNDLEVNANAGSTNSAIAFSNRIKQLGYSKVRHYSCLSWFQYGQLDANKLGYKNIWVAGYPYTPTKNLYTNYNSWQWASDLVFPGINGFFDISADYSGDFVAKDTPTPSSKIVMYRLYNPNNGEHFYTSNATERDKVKRAGWRYEGIGWNAPNGGTPVYRMYNPNAGDHFYTLNSYERDNLKHKGWRYEGIGWYSDSKKSIPLYRAYNPNARAGTHNYTVNYNEEKNLVAHGWRNEGIAWYGVN